MGRASYKQKCIVCRKNMALVTWKNRTPICSDCQVRDLNKPITDPKFKKLFDIEPELYKKSSFLRNIKSNYLRFGQLSDKQIEMFKKVAKEIKEKPNRPEPKPVREIPEADESDLD